MVRGSFEHEETPDSRQISTGWEWSVIAGREAGAELGGGIEQEFSSPVEEDVSAGLDPREQTGEKSHRGNGREIGC